MIDFQQALAAAVNQQSQTSSNNRKAEFWCNIGTRISEEQFVSLGGFPLDTIQRMSGSSTFAATRNALCELMLSKAQTLAPGDNIYIPAGAFQLQIKRIGDEKAISTTTGAVISAELLALFA